MKIVRLTAENFKRLRAIEITPDGNVVEIRGKNGAGKQQPISEPVLTPEGWRPLGAIRAGDYVTGSDGKPTKVLEIFSQTDRRTFLVTMKDGGSTRCGPDHLWTVSSWKSGIHGPRPRSAYRATEVLTTAQMIERGTIRGKHCRWSIPLVGPVEFATAEEELPIDPYALGVILGDGHIESTGYVTVTSMDSEIFDALNVANAWRSHKELGTAEWSRPLRHLGLAGLRSYEKFIPEIYQRATVKERESLFFGLMDTDGTTGNSWAEYCSTSERLVDDVVRLGSSLGFLCKKRPGATRKYRYKGELKEGRMAWTVSVKSEYPPFRLGRKKAKWSTSKWRPEPRRFIEIIEEVEPEDSVCIRVASEDGLYVTNDFIVTHNSSVLDAIMCAVAGGAALPSKPIRRGEESAKIELDLGELIVTRRFTAGGSTVTVEAASGARYRSPQHMLDELIGAIAFDPLEFTRMRPEKQLKELRRLVKLDVDVDLLDRQNALDYEQRAELNRAARTLRGQASGIRFPDNLPEDPVDVAALTQRLRQAIDDNTKIERLKAQREASAIDAGHMRRAAAARRGEAEDLRRRAEDLDRSATELETDAAHIDKGIAEAPPLPDPVDTSELVVALEDARTVNAHIDAKCRREILESDASAIEARADELTVAMGTRITAKTEAIAAAPMPVAGLGFGEGEVLFNGLPLDQASQAEKIRVSVALAMAANPKLKVLCVRDGSLLDQESWRLLTELIDGADYQCWVEITDNVGHSGIVIEDGAVRQPALAL